MKRTFLDSAKHVVTKQHIVLTLLIAFLYLVFSTLIINYRLLIDTFSNMYPLLYKAQLTVSLSTGRFWSMPFWESLILLLTSFLVGINITLLVKILRKMRHQGKLTFTTGGSSLLALVSAGCSSCGITLLSVLGVSSAIVPLKSLPLQYLSLGLLTFSLAYSVRKLHDKSCKIN